MWYWNRGRSSKTFSVCQSHRSSAVCSTLLTCWWTTWCWGDSLTLCSWLLSVSAHSLMASSSSLSVSASLMAWQRWLDRPMAPENFDRAVSTLTANTFSTASCSQSYLSLCSSFVGFIEQLAKKMKWLTWLPSMCGSACRAFSGTYMPWRCRCTPSRTRYYIMPCLGWWEQLSFTALY